MRSAKQRLLKHKRKTQRVKKTKSIRKRRAVFSAGTKTDDKYDRMERGELFNNNNDTLDDMEKGKSIYKDRPKIKFVPGSPLLDKFYAVKSQKERKLDEFHKKMKLDEQAYLADLESRDRYLRDPRNKTMESRESYFRRPELVDYHIDKKTGKLKNTFKSTHGLAIGLNEEKDGNPHEDDWGFYALDFRGGKRKTRRRRR